MKHLLLILSLAATTAHAAEPWPGQIEGDYTIHDYRFTDGETLPELKLHYMTLGTPRRDATGAIVNAVLLLHGTSGTGRNWLVPSFANELFAPGQPLDLARTYVILPDGIGRGGSSKASDGLHTRFPHYRYIDIVDSEHRLLTEHLGITHLRLLLGASMGGMQAWMWAGLYPGLMDVVVPMASEPVRMGGRNWLGRRIAIEAIRNDPGWHDGDYTTPPKEWVFTAPAGRLTTSNVLALQAAAPDVARGDAYYLRMVDDARRQDANNALYATEAVMDYAPEPLLPKIRAHLVAINSADDQVNPPELGVMQPAIAKIPGARYVLIPASPTTRGHYTYEQAALWKHELTEALAGH
jgi:homoserine O-acetyltransferase